MRPAISTLAHAASRGLRHVVDFCYPGRCAACEVPCESDVPLCEVCRIELHQLEIAAACERCAMPLAEHGAPCPYCRGEGVRPLEKIVRLGTFTDPIKHLIHQMKYHRRWPLAEFFADRLLEQERVKGLLTETDVVVPVPLYPLRQMLRGYNQADVIARRLATRCGIRFATPVIRLKNTETQTHLSQTARLENLRNAFGLTRAKSVRGKHVVIVDDVTTTGATLVSLARELTKAEPTSISAITIAISDPKGRGFEQI